MLNYLKKSYRKVKEDALSKIIYDIGRYFLALFFAYLLLNRIPITNAIGGFLQKKHQINFLQILIAVIVIILITILIQFLVYRRRFAMIKRDLHTDELTGLPNKKALDTELKEILNSAKKKRESLSLILMDIDDFKKFNTNHGQAIADEVLRKFGALLKSDSRITDKVYRQHVKGDEFVIVTNETKLDDAIIAANRKRELIAKTGIRVNELSPFTLTVCCGVVELNETDDEKSILDRAHSALLMAKDIEGKNQTKSLI